MNQLFFNGELDEGSREVHFGAEESRHISKSLRKRVGDLIGITNGKGLSFEVELVQCEARRTSGVVRAIHHKPPPSHRLHLAVAPLKSNERFDWLLEKSTEIGVTEITPIWCDRSERRTARMERWQRILESAMKQSLQYHLPVLNAPRDFVDWLEVQKQGIALIAHCQDGDKLSENEWTAGLRNPLTLAIGPEGDFSPEEVRRAQEKGFSAISLGPNRLRTETACIYGISQAVPVLRAAADKA